MSTSLALVARVSLLALATSLAALAGCATEASGPDADDVESDDLALTKAGEALVGSYVDDSGTFKGLVLTSERVGQQAKFFADIDSGIRCVRAPCPSTVRVEGTFSAGSRTITLRSTSPYAAVITGRYDYVRRGTKLTLTKGGKSQSLARERSYCAQSADCYAQFIIIPACLGQFDCEANACSWRCERPVAPPAAVTCTSSATCGAGQHCSVEDGVCNSTGMLAVCSGTCVAGDPQL